MHITGVQPLNNETPPVLIMLALRIHMIVITFGL